MIANMRWNIFARVLEDILITRGLHWQALHERTGLEEDTLTHLQASLLTPSAFPVLTNEEMDNVIDVLDLTTHEELQLRAAIIAASVEQILMERIESHAALQASEQVFATSLAALVKQKDEKYGDSGFTGNGVEKFFHQVKRAIDAGTRARQLGRFTATEVRVEALQEAFYHFEQARDLLERESSLSTTNLWNTYYRAVQKEMDQISRELRSL